MPCHAGTPEGLSVAVDGRPNSNPLLLFLQRPPCEDRYYQKKSLGNAFLAQAAQAHRIKHVPYMYHIPKGSARITHATRGGQNTISKPIITVVLQFGALRMAASAALGNLAGLGSYLPSVGTLCTPIPPPLPPPCPMVSSGYGVYGVHSASLNNYYGESPSVHWTRLISF